MVEYSKVTWIIALLQLVIEKSTVVKMFICYFAKVRQILAIHSQNCMDMSNYVTYPPKQKGSSPEK